MDIINGLQTGMMIILPTGQLDTLGSTATTEQDSIGWGAALEGCITKWWREEWDQIEDLQVKVIQQEMDHSIHHLADAYSMGHVATP